MEYNDGIQAFELDAGIGGGKLPDNSGFGGITLGLPGCDLASQGQGIWNTTVETLVSQYG